MQNYEIINRLSMSFKTKMNSVWRLYADGFKNMTWGRPLWGLIILKIVILFGVLRLFFFQPVLSGLSEEERSEHVGSELIVNTYQQDSPEEQE